MPDEPEQILRDQETFEKENTPVEIRESMFPGDYVSESKELIRTGGDIGGNSRILRLASIARYRKKRRMMTADKAGRSEQLRSDLPARMKKIAALS